MEDEHSGTDFHFYKSRNFLYALGNLALVVFGSVGIIKLVNSPRVLNMDNSCFSIPKKYYSQVFDAVKSCEPDKRKFYLSAMDLMDGRRTDDFLNNNCSAISDVACYRFLAGWRPVKAEIPVYAGYDCDDRRALCGLFDFLDNSVLSWEDQLDLLKTLDLSDCSLDKHLDAGKLGVFFSEKDKVLSKLHQ